MSALLHFVNHMLTASRADYADDEYIQELIHWTHPFSDLPSDFQFTEQENLAMLKLPRKECEHLLVCVFPGDTDLPDRPSNATSDAQSVLDAAHTIICVCV